jgi:hypothetical protein
MDSALFFVSRCNIFHPSKFSAFQKVDLYSSICLDRNTIIMIWVAIHFRTPHISISLLLVKNWNPLLSFEDYGLPFIIFYECQIGFSFLVQYLGLKKVRNPN